MSSDIRDILSRLTAVESKLTPAMPKVRGLNTQQKGVPQLPALFKPKDISVLGGKKDPKHPMAGYSVGSNESVEPAANKLAEAMAAIEEDMLSKVKKDLTQYLDRLEQKVKIDRELKDKALDAVEKHQPEEDIEENDYELTDPSTVHDVEDHVNVDLAQPQAPVQTETLEDGAVFEIHGDDHNGFEIRHQGRSLPSKFKNLDDAGMAIQLFRAHRQKQAAKNPNQDYVEER